MSRIRLKENSTLDKDITGYTVAVKDAGYSFPKPISRAARRRRHWILKLLVALGFLALGYYFSWWPVHGAQITLWLYLFLAGAVVCAIPQLIGNWVLYLKAREYYPARPPAEDPTVDVYITAYHEPYELVKRTLTAAREMRGPHQTWLLDDGNDPLLAALAQELGVGYLARKSHTGAKAGNINTALKKTGGDIIVIFDIDHAPEPGFLERTLSHFSNPEVGFVQVMLTFANSKMSWTARAATESSYDYYNPTSKGADTLGSATLTGSNALIRRTALESIGGYRPGLAEDLATSIALHAAGWRSVYVPEPLAPGLAPPDLLAWFTQQFKWSRGVFELLVTDYLRYFRRLSWGQRLSYSVRMTYYWIGPVVAVHLLVTILVLLSGSAVASAALQSYLIHLVPLAVMALLIRQVALVEWRHPTVFNGVLWRPVSLIYATWPIYTLAWVMAVLRLPLGFRPTPKEISDRLNPVWLLPQTFSLMFLAVGTVYAYSTLQALPLLLLFYVAGQGLLQLAIFFQWAEARNAENGNKLSNHL